MNRNEILHDFSITYLNFGSGFSGNKGSKSIGTISRIRS